MLWLSLALAADPSVDASAAAPVTETAGPPPLLMVPYPYLGTLNATPWEDPATWAIDRQIRGQGVDRFMAGRNPGLVSLVDRAEAVGWALPQSTDGWRILPGAALEAGTLDPDNNSGWEEDGRVGLSLLPGAELSMNQFVLRATPRLSAGDAGVSAGIGEVWLGTEASWGRLGFGKEPRWIGPGRFSTLMLSDNAVPPWMGNGALEGRLPGKATVLGRFRGELGVGLLDQPRRDVDAPGLLLMDMRWLPIPILEMGATRMSIFGGVGRPPIDLGQLILPTEPHIYNDPDKILPDQDELARLDFRLTLPLQKWLGGPLRYLEGWWEYGGEDVIKREIGSLPYPALAGVGNLYGLEVAAGPVTLSGEYSRLMDDYFRWYVGHRVYHDGFTQNLRVLGQFGGPDSESYSAALAVDTSAWRARFTVQWLHQVGVIEAFNDRLFAYPTEAHRLSVGLEGGLPLPRQGYVSVGLGYAQATGIDFIPDNDANTWRVNIGFVPAGQWAGVFKEP